MTMLLHLIREINPSNQKVKNSKLNLKDIIVITIMHKQKINLSP